MSNRKRVPRGQAAQVLAGCRRRCALCFGLHGDQRTKRGQLAHLDRNPRNSHPDNLVFLCMHHHDEFDSRHTQTRSLLPAELRRYRYELEQAMLRPSAPQRVRWGPNDGLPAGISIARKGGPFVPWARLRVEVKINLLSQLGLHVPPNCRVLLRNMFGRKNWTVRIVDSDDREVGHVWFGSDPDHEWRYDGLVRVGKPLDDYAAEVWQVFQRFSDGSYRRLDRDKALVPP